MRPGSCAERDHPELHTPARSQAALPSGPQGTHLDDLAGPAHTVRCGEHQPGCDEVSRRLFAARTKERDSPDLRGGHGGLPPKVGARSCSRSRRSAGAGRAGWRLGRDRSPGRRPPPRT
ncbi:unnamed protein product [[Actinomadura] parvosata subsp. kistnae]|nr:unnamed protein product [Actinomadura parvosata subsp. kistnae]